MTVAGPSRLAAAGCLAFGLVAGGCSTEAEPQHPAWADVAPIFRGECNGCHGWTAPKTGSSYRFDFFDMTRDVCGDAALALSAAPLAELAILAGSAPAPTQIATDVLTAAGAEWPRMPPQPSPALPGWERDALERWGVQPVKGAPPPGNRPPTIELGSFPAVANGHLTFSAVLDDPDGDSVVGVIEANQLAFLMNRPGSFQVDFDSSSWPAGPQAVTAVVCDGWTNARFDLGAVTIER
jgi:hypothetical protein